MKICIIGHSGSGKSTLAEILGEKYGLPVLHLDATFWYGNWQSRTREEQTSIVEDFLCKNTGGWIIEGNYFKICLQRFAECDKLYFLDYNRLFCFKSAYGRYKKYKGTCRPDCPCMEKFDWEFAWWILHKGRTRKHKKQFAEAVGSCTNAHVFKTRKRLNEYLDTLK